MFKWVLNCLHYYDMCRINKISLLLPISYTKRLIFKAFMNIYSAAHFNILMHIHKRRVGCFRGIGYSFTASAALICQSDSRVPSGTRSV